MRKGKKIKPKPLQSVRAPAVPTLLAGARGSWGLPRAAAAVGGVWPAIASHVLGDEAQDRMCFITVNNDPDYCLGLPFLVIGGCRHVRSSAKVLGRGPEVFITDP